MTSKSKQYCSVPQCNNYISKNVSMHKFPSDKIIQEQWKRALDIGKPITKYMCVCSEHFVSEDFSKNNPNPLKRHLKKGVIPSGRIPSTSDQKIGNTRSLRKSLAVDKSMEVGPVSDHMVHPGHLNEHLTQPLMPVDLVDEFNEGIKTFVDKGVKTEVQDFQLLDVLDTDKKLMSFTAHHQIKSTMNCDSSSSEDEYNPSNGNANGRNHPMRTARKSTTAPQPQPSTGYSTRRQAAKNASRAISASTGTSSFEKTMENFNPDLSQREKRKISKKFQTPAPRKPLGSVYDERGRHISTGLDLCDCLNERCQGCFFPCPKCSSQKCGADCRVFRTFIIDSLEYHGYDKIVKNPLLLRN